MRPNENGMRARTAAAVLALAVLVTAAGRAPAATVHVPADQPTIQAGIDAAGDGGTVIVAPGMYTGTGNRDIDFGGMNVTLVSSGGAASTVIDCEGLGCAFFFHTGEDSTSTIDGFTVRNGLADWGGAVRCQGASPTIQNCVFESNEASLGGGAIHAESSSAPTVEDCVFAGNTSCSGGAIYHSGAAGAVQRCTFNGNTATERGGAAYLSFIAETTFRECVFQGNTAASGGGAVYSVNAESVFDGCTFVGNVAPTGGGAYVQANYTPPEFLRCTFADNEGGGLYSLQADPVISYCVFAFDRTEAGIVCAGSGVPEITHSFFFGNAGGDSLCGDHSDNVFEDPLFCDVFAGNVDYCSNSPCLVGANPWGEEVGSGSEGCPDCDSPVDMSTWGSVKWMYRPRE